MYNNYRWCEMVAYEKIAQARRAAAHDRLALTAVSGRRDVRQAAVSPVAGLLRSLASAFGRGRSAQETMVPARHTR
jgi:hypothetical protein